MINDPYFRVKVLRRTPDPQQLCWLAAHQDYCEDFVGDRLEDAPSELQSGDRLINMLLQGGKGHFGALEHPSITFNVGWFPHSVMQQARTHRIATFDVQSGRYTGKRYFDVTEGRRSLEEVVYFRPPGEYTDRSGDRYTYSQEWRDRHKAQVLTVLAQYCQDVGGGMSEEHARGMGVFDFRQHFVVTFNARSLMHFLDLRAKKDSQLEIQALSELMMEHFEEWMPAIAAWYKENRWLKGRLAP